MSAVLDNSEIGNKTVADNNTFVSSTSLNDSAEDQLPTWNKPVWALMLCAITFPAISVINSIGHTEQQLPPLCTLFLIVTGIRSIHRRASAEPRGRSFMGALALFTISIINAIATLFSLTTVYLVTLIGLLSCAAWALFGLKYLRRFVPVVVFACFSLVPFEEELRSHISLPLQMMSIKMMQLITEHLIPISVNSHFFTVESVTYDVAPACSGLNQWVAFCYAFLIWQMFQRFTRRGWLEVAVSVPILMLLSNATRLTITALIAFYGSKDLALSIHSNLEFVLCPLCLICIWLIARRHYAPE